MVSTNIISLHREYNGFANLFSDISEMNVMDKSKSDTIRTVLWVHYILTYNSDIYMLQSCNFLNIILTYSHFCAKEIYKAYPQK